MTQICVKMFNVSSYSHAGLSPTLFCVWSLKKKSFSLSEITCTQIAVLKKQKGRTCNFNVPESYTANVFWSRNLQHSQPGWPVPNLKQTHQNKRELWFTVRFVITGKSFYFHCSTAPHCSWVTFVIKKVICYLGITPVICSAPTFATIHAVTMILITDLSKWMDFIYSQYQQTKL